MVGRRVFKHVVQSSEYNTLDWPWSAESDQRNRKTERQGTGKKQQPTSTVKLKSGNLSISSNYWKTYNEWQKHHQSFTCVRCMWCEANMCVFFPFCPFSSSPSPHSHSCCSNKHCSICSHILKQICVGLLGMRSLVRPQSMTYYYTPDKPPVDTMTPWDMSVCAVCNLPPWKRLFLLFLSLLPTIVVFFSYCSLDVWFGNVTNVYFWISMKLVDVKCGKSHWICIEPQWRWRVRDLLNMKKV